jgi:hypothetical protein
LVDPKNNDSMSSEIENRLDDLFGESDLQLAEATENNPAEHYPLAELKNLILSIDWEITDEVLDNLLLQLKDLQSSYQHDKIVTTFLQILSSLGSYIRTHRAKAPPQTFRILNSVFSGLDKVVLSKDMTEPEKKKILRAEMNRYKDLRALIDQSKKAAVKRKAEPAAAQVPEKKQEPVITLDEPSATLERKEKEQEPVSLQDEPSVVPDTNEEEEKTVTLLVEHPVGPGTNENEEEPVTLLEEPSVGPGNNEKEEAPLITLGEPYEPSAEAAKEGLPVTHPESEREQPAVASLADAVEEIKQYIHTEIKALKEEIQSLREQK